MSVRVEPAPGGARVSARDWPGAPFVAAPCLALGVPALAWAAATGHAVEAGGGVVLAAFGALAAWLALAKRRDLVVSAEPGAVRVRGREGCGPFARPVDLALPPDASVEVVPFAVPPGAPDVPEAGGDLVLRAAGSQVPLARLAGPAWRPRLDAAAAAVAAAIRTAR